MLATKSPQTTYGIAVAIDSARPELTEMPRNSLYFFGFFPIYRYHFLSPLLVICVYLHSYTSSCVFHALCRLTCPYPSPSREKFLGQVATPWSTTHCAYTLRLHPNPFFSLLRAIPRSVCFTPPHLKCGIIPLKRARLCHRPQTRSYAPSRSIFWSKCCIAAVLEICRRDTYDCGPTV